MEMKGWIYQINRTNTVRYILGTEGLTSLVCIGVNPSTAEPFKLDPTLKSVERIAKHHGFDSWIMLNLYPQRSTNPNNLHSCRDEYLHRKNLLHFENILTVRQPVIWAAWGTLVTKRPYLMECLRDICELTKKHECSWVTFGKRSKDGHPHHPLYLRKDFEMDDFDLEEYLKNHSNG